MRRSNHKTPLQEDATDTPTATMMPPGDGANVLKTLQADSDATWELETFCKEVEPCPSESSCDRLLQPITMCDASWPRVRVQFQDDPAQ